MRPSSISLETSPQQAESSKGKSRIAVGKRERKDVEEECGERLFLDAVACRAMQSGLRIRHAQVTIRTRSSYWSSTFCTRPNRHEYVIATSLSVPA